MRSVGLPGVDVLESVDGEDNSSAVVVSLAKTLLDDVIVTSLRRRCCGGRAVGNCKLIAPADERYCPPIGIPDTTSVTTVPLKKAVHFLHFGHNYQFNITINRNLLLLLDMNMIITY